ncbi:MAG: tetratricopeptide repeat protein [Anaerolineae bacterium]
MRRLGGPGCATLYDEKGLAMATELKLTFSKRGRGWRVVLGPGWGAQPSQPAPFRSPLTEKDYEDLRWYLEEFMDFPGAGDYVRARDVEQRLEAWGLDFYEQLFGHGDWRELLNDLLDGDPPRVLSVASKANEGEAARQAGDEPLARQRFQEAVQLSQESLGVWEQTNNRHREAELCSNLGRLYLLLGDLEQAEEHAHRAREIREELRLPDVYKGYWTLEDIARARGDAAGAAEWQCKKEAVLAELERRAGGGYPQAFVEAVEMLCLAVGQAALAGEEVPPRAEENLVALEDYPAPWDQVGRFL